jgi:hypothetical protein
MLLYGKLVFVGLLSVVHALKNGDCLRTCALWIASALVLAESPIPGAIFAFVVYKYDQFKKDSQTQIRGHCIVDFGATPPEKRWSRQTQNSVSAALLLALVSGGQHAISIVGGVLAMELSPQLTFKPPQFLMIVCALFLASACGLWRALVQRDASRSMHAFVFQIAFAITLDKPRAALMIPVIYIFT